METLDELIEYIVEHNNLAGEDSDVFRYILPDEPLDVVCIIPYGGSSTPLYSETCAKNFQIVVRRQTNSQANKDAVKIFKSLRPVDSPYIKLKTMDCPIELKDYPFYLKTMQNNCVLYAFNIVITSMN